jgi:hypothetical protein
MRSLRDIQNALQVGLPLYKGPFGNLEGVRLSGLLREINSIEGALQTVHLSLWELR